MELESNHGNQLFPSDDDHPFDEPVALTNGKGKNAARL
jgi:hypothetical protein